MAVKVILEGKLGENVDDGEVLAATVDEGATVGNGLHVRITSVDKHRQHRALRLVAGQRVRVTVELIAEDVASEPAAAPEPEPLKVVGEGDRWATLVAKVDDRRRLEAYGG